eukprot:TRINITY_DN80524_c0_g1_i1.p1 TRINITY_DN80524_c0_g1~~TRINITY_DN80524_c0_g1_i1.p1  ORF type:complete len:300 (+),score=42.38 TRINITY_DN80524_c0_g1_i1:127-1026(+)
MEPALAEVLWSCDTPSVVALAAVCLPNSATCASHLVLRFQAQHFRWITTKNFVALGRALQAEDVPDVVRDAAKAIWNKLHEPREAAASALRELAEALRSDLRPSQKHDSGCWHFGVWQILLEAEHFVVRESISGALLTFPRDSNGHYTWYDPALISRDALAAPATIFPGMRNFVDLETPMDPEDCDTDYVFIRSTCCGTFAAFSNAVAADDLHLVWQDGLDAENDIDVVWHAVCIGDHLFVAGIPNPDGAFAETGDFTVLFEFCRYSSMVHVVDIDGTSRTCRAQLSSGCKFPLPLIHT